MGTREDTQAVTAIEEGTVIDHIAAGSGLRLIQLLHLDTHHLRVSVGLNFASPGMGTKDIIKIEGRALNPDEANQVAIFAPDATISIIKNFTVEEKFAVALPDIIERVIVCPNPSCVTNHESTGTGTRFGVQQRRNDIRLHCHYCMKTFSQSDIKDYNG